MQVILFLVGLLVLHASATTVSRQLCGTSTRGAGIKGGLCDQVLASYEGELPPCYTNADAVASLQGVVDLFSPDMVATLPEAATNLLSRGEVCVTDGYADVFSSDLKYYREPWMEGPCNQDLTVTTYSPPENPTSSQVEDARWLNYQENFGGDTSGVLDAPACYEDDDTWGGRPYCSVYADPGGHMCTKLARFFPYRNSGNNETTGYGFQHCLKVKANPDKRTATPMAEYCHEWAPCPITMVNGQYQAGPCPPAPAPCNAPRDLSVLDNPYSYFEESGYFPECDLDDKGYYAGPCPPPPAPCNAPRTLDAEPKFSAVEELFQIASQLRVTEALQAADPWNALLAQVCSCACGHKV